MSNALVLEQPQVGIGLQIYTFTIPTTLPTGQSGSGLYNVKVQCSVPQALSTGTSAGSGTGLGNGAGGGGEGFVRGDFGPGFGGVGQGFGPSNGYQQPPALVTSNPQGPSVASGLSITIVNTTTSSTLYTSTSFAPSEDYQKFTFPFQAAAGNVITITYSSSTGSDLALNGIKSTTTISQGFN